MARKMSPEQQEAWEVLQEDVVSLAKENGWASKSPQGVNPSYAFTSLEHPDLPARLSASIPVDPDGKSRFIYGSTVITGKQLQALLTTLTLPEPPTPEKKPRTRRTSAAHSAAHTGAPVPPTSTGSAAHTQDAVPPISGASAAHSESASAAHSESASAAHPWSDPTHDVAGDLAEAAEDRGPYGPAHAAMKKEFESTDPIAPLDTERLAFRDVKRHVRQAVKVAKNADVQIYSQQQVREAVREYADTALWSPAASTLTDAEILKKAIGSEVMFLNRVSGRSDTANVHRASDKAKYPPHITGEVFPEDHDDRRILHFLDGAGFRSVAVGLIRSIG